MTTKTFHENEKPKTAKCRVVRGFPCPSSSWFTQKNIEDTMDYVPHDDDIVIASYPKTGTTWLQYIVFQIISKGELYPSFDDSVQKFAPFMEMIGTDAIDEMAPPRIYKHHFPYDRVQMNDKAKCLYIYRNPEDTCVSYHHFIKALHIEIPELPEYFESFLTGDIAYGHYFENLRSYLAHKDDPNLLMISYEKLMRNREEEILRIAKFLGDEYHRALAEDERLLKTVIERTSFAYMKKNLDPDHPEDIVKQESPRQGKVNFFRKGVIGDGKKSLTPDQLSRLRGAAREMLKSYEHVLRDWFDD